MHVPIKKDISAARANVIYSFFDVEQGPLVEKATARIFKHLDIYQAYEEFKIQSVGIRINLVIDMINEEYNKKDIPEDEVSKILRLKIIETKVANEVINRCRTYECRGPIISLTKNPLFCRALNYKDVDNCIVQYSDYDKETCRYIRDEELRKNCLNESFTP